MQAARTLRDQGMLLFPVFYPIIAKGKAMLRFAISADHSGKDIKLLGAALGVMTRKGLWTPAVNELDHA